MVNTFFEFIIPSNNNQKQNQTYEMQGFYYN